MPYILSRYNGNVTVNDNGITSVANITLPGKNYLGYGQPVDQSLLSMTEHFASSTGTVNTPGGGPTNPITGQIWYDTSSNPTAPNGTLWCRNKSNTAWDQILMSGAAVNTANYVIAPAQPNITSVGTLTSLTVSGPVQTPNLTTGAAAAPGTITGQWTLTAGSTLNATYADLAEKYASDKEYPAGTLLMIGGDKEVTLATENGKWKLAGVVTTSPAYVLNSTLLDSVSIALVGRVPCLVTGNISKGDMLTISNIDGVATSSTTREWGTIIGRALESYNDSNVGTIEIKVDRA